MDLAESVGVLVILAMAAPLVLGVWWIHRIRAPRPPPGDEPGRAVADPPSGADTRIPLRFGVGLLLVLVVEGALVVLVPWSIAARELGPAGLLASALFVVPMLAGLLHAASRGPLEW